MLFSVPGATNQVSLWKLPWEAGLGDGHGATVVSTLAISLGILEAGLPDSYQPMTRTTSLGPRQGSSWGGQHQLRTLLEAGIIIQ